MSKLGNCVYLEKSENEIHTRFDSFDGEALELAWTCLSKAKSVGLDVNLVVVYQLMFAQPGPRSDCPVSALENDRLYLRNHFSL